VLSDQGVLQAAVGDIGADAPVAAVADVGLERVNGLAFAQATQLVVDHRRDAQEL
jgi:hypothetical protein